jgi:catechol 2,3-dioxygenase-like lactoylglutathione lyase family enzyme
MAPAPVSGIGNIILAVEDMARSLAFYRDSVGLPVRFANAEFAFLQAGHVTLCLRHAPAAAQSGARDETRVEIVFSVDDIHAAYEALKARGVTFRVEPRAVTGELWATDFRDPDAHLLSIFGPSHGQAQA